MPKTVQRTISLPAHPRHLHEVREMVQETLRELALPQREKDHIVLAVDEAVAPIIHYARFKGYRNEITLTVDIDEVRFKAVIVDSLNVFDINGGLQDPSRIEKERGFSLGIFLIRQVMDEIQYTYRKGFENELVLIKFLG